MPRTYVEMGTDIIGGEVYPGLERLQYRLRQLAATRGGDQAYLLAREVEDLRDRLRQAWGLLRRDESESAPKAGAAQAR
ncbi:MAG TPA: hypothetical protein VKB92_08690 [Myxococcales bacterium]|jgi:hypothetical protein|nr:hypothetical protein [Myxococcales bacterium]